MKDMKKNKAVIVLLCILLLLAGVTYVDLFGVDGEGAGSASDISLGLDLAGGASALPTRWWGTRRPAPRT